jgi:hypothetical protein
MAPKAARAKNANAKQPAKSKEKVSATTQAVEKPDKPKKPTGKVAKSKTSADNEELETPKPTKVPRATNTVSPAEVQTLENQAASSSAVQCPTGQPDLSHALATAGKLLANKVLPKLFCFGFMVSCRNF